MTGPRLGGDPVAELLDEPLAAQGGLCVPRAEGGRVVAPQEAGHHRIPIVAAVYLARKQNDPFGAAVCLFWLGTALFGAGVYAADARAQALPLVSPFGPVDVDSHDWTVMLLRFGMLTKDEAIGAALRNMGVLSMLASIASGAWVLRVMATATKEQAGGA